jgi:catechol 2,3-dioxygenase-like lactoylglutathione lyase family enzyme
VPVVSCVPVIPSADLEKTLRLWRDGLGFSPSREMYKDGRMVGCMLDNGKLWFWLNQRAGTPVRPEEYHGISLYWTPSDLQATREQLKSLGFAVSDIVERDYGQTEFFLTDDDGFDHCFGVGSAGCR